MPVEGATRADDKTSEASFEGEAPVALPLEGATRAPVIVGGNPDGMGPTHPIRKSLLICL